MAAASVESSELIGPWLPTARSASPARSRMSSTSSFVSPTMSPIQRVKVLLRRTPIGLPLRLADDSDPGFMDPALA
jgi:hypothetical protein